MRVLCGRPFIDLDLEGPLGSSTACAWVDTGGGAFFMAGALADSLGLEWELPPDHQDGEFGQAKTAPSVTNFPIQPDASRMWIKPGRLFEAGYPATAFLPAHLLLGRDVLFDYPDGQFDICIHGSVEAAGEELAAPRHPGMGFPRIELEVDGERLGFLLDTGAPYTMVSDSLIGRWLERHPTWPSTFGATRHAAMGRASIDMQRLIRVPEVRWGSSLLSGVGMVARPEGTFEGYMTKMMTAPIVGALAGNVLSSFRFQLAEESIFIEQKRDIDSHDLDGVGLALAVDDDGRFSVLGICDAADESVKRLVQAGDIVLSVDGQETTGRLSDDVFASLAGPPDETRSLTLRRDGTELTVEVTTAAIL